MHALRMHAPARVRSLWAVAPAAALAAWRPGSADLRISDLDVFLNDHELTVNVALLGAIPPTFHEGLQSGIPAHVRYTVELWQYQRYWRDNLLLSKVVERQLAYNVVTKEYRVSALQGESREPHLTRDMRDALSACCPSCAVSSSRRPARWIRPRSSTCACMPRRR